MRDLGDRTEDSTIDFGFHTSNTSGVPTTLAGSPVVSVYKGNSITQSTADVTLTPDFDGVTGLNHVNIDLGVNVFYAAANDYKVVITAGTVGGTSVVGAVVATFSIENRFVRGTDNAALASVLGAVADAAAAGDPTATDTVMAYAKQLINVLVGTAGVGTFPAEQAPADAVSLSEVIRAIHADVTGLAGSTMRGTDSAALASVLGAVADAAADGDPTATDTVVAYAKQLINVLVGTAGVVTYPTEQAPANAVSLAEVIRAIHADVTGLAGSTMRGTDNAALASVLGALADVAADGDPTATDTAMAYAKQLINVLVGTAGVATFPTEQAPANAVSLAEVVRAIHADVTGLAGSTMRGTDNAALASVLGALADTAADGDPTATDTVVAYAKQLINVLVGTAGVVTYPAEQAPANAISLAEVIRAIHADVTGLAGSTMRGTDNAALASVLGAVADAAAAGDPTATDTVVAYAKQLINVLVGTAGVGTFPAEQAPADAVSLAEVVRAIHADVTGLAGSTMRGTDSALQKTTVLTEGYAADGADATVEQILYMLLAIAGEFAIVTTTLTCKMLDGTTTAMTFTLDDASNPTSRTRAT